VGIVMSTVFILTIVKLTDTFGIPFTKYQGSYGLQKNQVLSYLSLVADLKKERVVSWLYETDGDLQILCKTTDVKVSTEKLAGKLQTGDGDYAQNLIHDLDYARLLGHLMNIITTHERYGKIEIAVAKNDMILASTEPGRAGKPLINTKSFRAALKNPEGTSVEVESDPVDDRPNVVFGRVIRGASDSADSNGLAVALVYVDLEKYVRPMLYLGQGMGNSGEIVLVAEDSTLLMSLKYQPTPGQTAKVLKFKNLAVPARAAASGKEEVVVADDYRGVPVLAATRFINVAKNRGWGFVVKQDTAEIFAKLWAGLLFSLFTSICGLLGAGVIAVIISNRITNPIHLLNKAAQDVASGNLEATAPIPHTPDLRVLADTFNSMVGKIKNWRSELEIQIEERTAQLRVEISERERVEEALRLSERQYRRLYEKAPIPLHSLNANFGIESVSDAWLDLLGFGKDEVIGRQFTDFLTLESKFEEETINVPTFLHHGALKNVLYKMVKKDGETIDVKLSSISERDEEGRIVGSLNGFYEVTKQLNAEKALQKAHDDLELRVFERTRDLERANAELKQFAYVASHDLKEPLRNISVCVQMLGAKCQVALSPPADQLIHHATEGSRRAIQLIDGLLEYSRINTRSESFDYHPSAKIVEDCMADLELMIKENDARIMFDDLPVIYCDSAQIRTLFQNLIANAIKFKSKTTPIINISAEKQNGSWVFSVRDNGIGIMQDYFHKIFVIFQRLHSRVEYPGTGMGLAIAKKIVERHDGRIWVESEIGKGSVFKFTVPEDPQQVV
jgi:PAS domain S-box-containing protein